MEDMLLNDMASIPPPRRILILSSDLSPSTSANGVCVLNIAREYVKKGYAVFGITKRMPDEAVYEYVEGIHIYRINAAWFPSFYAKWSQAGIWGRAISKVVHILRNLSLILVFPNVAPVRSRKMFRLAEKIVRDEHIDTIIGSYRPYESVYTTIRLKRKYKEKLRCITYYLDIMMQNKYANMWHLLFKQAVIHAQRKDIRYLDRVCIPSANKLEFENCYGVHPNVEFVEFPMYIKRKNACLSSQSFPEDEISLVYIGTLNRQDRNPEEFFEILSVVHRSIPSVHLHIWGNVQDVQDLMLRYSSFVTCHGYIESKYTCEILRKADWVVNIGNRVNYNMVPSKIFQLFATGRPVIDFAYSRDDVSLPYFAKYGNAEILYADEPKKVVQKRIVQKLQCEYKSVNADQLFVENMPRYVAERIIGEVDAGKWFDSCSDQ